MSILASIAETRIVLSNISWQTFESLVAEADQHGTRFAYDRGILEIMSPSVKHEWYRRLLGRLVETFTLERNIPIRSIGATTLKSQLEERGLEPDESYYVTHEAAVRDCLDLDLTRDPPPDLAIEVEISRSADRQARDLQRLGRVGSLVLRWREASDMRIAARWKV